MGEPARDELAARRYGVDWDKDKTPPKPVLPKLPGHADAAGQCAFMTSVLGLGWDHPIIRGSHQGLHGRAGHVEFQRLDAPPIRFEPAANLANGQKLRDELVWQLLPTDGEDVFPWSNSQAMKIARVAQLLCGNSKRPTTEQETMTIVAAFTEAADAVEGHRTYGTTGERYEAAVALRPDDDQYGRPLKPRYLLDADTGETVIRVSDLAAVARRVRGGSLVDGWLDARMEALGWERRTLDGRALPGRDGRAGPHTRPGVYRGHLPTPDVDARADNGDTPDQTGDHR